MPDIAPQIAHLLPQRNEQEPHVGPADDRRAERDGRRLDRAAERGAHDDGDGAGVREGVLEAEALGFAVFGEEGVADLVGGLAGGGLVGVVKKGRGISYASDSYVVLGFAVADEVDYGRHL